MRIFLFLLVSVLTSSAFATCNENLDSNRISLEAFVLQHTEQIPRTAENGPADSDAISLTFFDVKIRGKPDKEEFERLVAFFKPRPGSEKGYLELGALLGSQELALRTMALGYWLGTWRLLSPETVLPDAPFQLKHEIAGRGYITIMSDPVF